MDSPALPKVHCLAFPWVINMGLEYFPLEAQRSVPCAKWGSQAEIQKSVESGWILPYARGFVQPKGPVGPALAHNALAFASATAP